MHERPTVNEWQMILICSFSTDKDENYREQCRREAVAPLDYGLSNQLSYESINNVEGCAAWITSH